MTEQTIPDDTNAPRPMPAWYRVAAAMLVTTPSVTHREIAKKTGRARVTVTRAMHTRQMQRAIDDALAEHWNFVAVAAPRALIAGFSKGRGLAQALKVLQLRGVAPTDRLELTGAGGSPLIPGDVSEQIRAYTQRLLSGTVEAPAAPEQTSPEVAEPGTQGDTD
jgi:hypothetical protein